MATGKTELGRAMGCNVDLLTRRRLPVGAEVLPQGGVHFRVWATRCQRVTVVIESTENPGVPVLTVALTAERNGDFSGVVPSAGTGMLYRYGLEDDADVYPDPASRFQPYGPHGPSQIVVPQAFQWTDHTWAGVHLEGQVIYELHLGTLTPEGTWEAAGRELPELAAAGITLIGEACLGTVSEIFDAEPPFTPRGCVSQAWSVAETLRCWVKTAG
jgi:maltooligosyltrehalose trehalohydrolase